jgi:hypothetical protein
VDGAIVPVLSRGDMSGDESVPALSCCRAGAVVPGDASGRFIQAFDLLGVRVSSVRMNGGRGSRGRCLRI